MKKIVFVFAMTLSGMAITSFTQFPKDKEVQTIVDNQAIIKWDNTKIDNGKSAQGNEVEFVFKFTNQGDVPLTITRVKPSCGCTLASFTKEPILPGEEGTIITTYNGAKKGSYRKSITVTSNAEPSVQTLFISGEII